MDRKKAKQVDDDNAQHKIRGNDKNQPAAVVSPIQCWRTRCRQYWAGDDLIPDITKSCRKRGGIGE